MAVGQAVEPEVVAVVELEVATAAEPEAVQEATMEAAAVAAAVAAVEDQGPVPKSQLFDMRTTTMEMAPTTSCTKPATALTLKNKATPEAMEPRLKVLLIVAFVGFAACGRLDSQYLPPNNGGAASGQYSGSSSSGQYSGSTSSGQYSGGGSSSTGKYSGSSSGQYSGSSSGQYSGASSAGQYSGATGHAGAAAEEIPILRLENNNNGDGTYNFALETGNGISAQEEGDATGDGTIAHGGFSYTAPDGQQIQVQYSADENGFAPQGAHLPTPPPIPEEIQRAVEQNLADEARGVFDDGQYKEEASPSQKYGGGQQSQYGGAQQNQYAGAQAAPQNQYGAPAAHQGGQAQGGYKY